MNTSEHKTAIDAIVINDKKELLLVNKKGQWILPWGKQELGDTDVATLQRELSEELQAVIDGWSLKEYKTFSGVTPFSQKLIDVKTYFTQLEETGTYIQSSNKITDARFTKEFDDVSLSKITRDILEALQRDWYLPSNDALEIL